MSGEFNSAAFFLDLLAIMVVLLPAIAFIRVPLIRRLLMIASGGYLLFFIAPRLLGFYVVMWFVVFLLQRLIAATAERRGGTGVLWLGILLALAPMIAWKIRYDEFNIVFNLWSNGFVGLLPGPVEAIDLARPIIIPIGLSFATFRAVDLLVKTNLGRFDGLSIDRVFFYGFFPPVQVVGPIIEYDEIQRGGDAWVPPNAEDLLAGALRIATGFLKAVVLAGILQPSGEVFANAGTAGVPLLWLNLFLYMWFFYLNFAGYSDLAIGAARMLGFRLKENFSWPYFRRNIAEFWNNWNMSLSRFAQRNAFVPLGGYRPRTQYLALLGTIMVIALWHDISIAMVLFGSYHGFALILHRWYQSRHPDARQPGPLGAWGRIVATNLFVMLSFPLLVLPIGAALRFYAALFGF